MQRARASEREKSKIAGIVPLFNRNHANGLFHGGIHHADDPGSQLFGRPSQAMFPDPLRKNRARPVKIEAKLAA